MEKFYIHPINMDEGYVDEKPTRDLKFALAPQPDTIGPFSSREEVAKWVAGRPARGYRSLTIIVRKS